MLGDGSGTGFNMRHDYMYGNESEISSFYRIPKILLENRIYSDMSADAKLLYAIFLDRASLSAANEWKDEDGRIYIIFQVEDIMRILGCGNQKASKLLAELENSYDLIERKKQGFCKPNLIYVKAVSTLMLESHVQKCENHISGSVKTTRTEVLKSHTNNTNYNNTYKNNTNHISHESDDENMEKRIALKKYFWETLSVEKLIEEYPTRKEILNEIVEVILDTVCSNQKTIYVAKDYKPKKIVDSRFMKLQADHIRNVLEIIEKATNIRNTKQYILTALYNSTLTVNSYFTMQNNNSCATETKEKETNSFNYFSSETKNEELLKQILHEM